MIGAFGPWAWLNVKNPMDEDLIQDPFQNFVHGCDLYEHFEVLAIRSDIQKDDLSQPFFKATKGLYHRPATLIYDLLRFCCIRRIIFNRPIAAYAIRKPPLLYIYTHIQTHQVWRPQRQVAARPRARPI